MKNILAFFLFLFSLNCFAQDSTNPIDFKFQDDYILSDPSLYLKCRNDIYFFISDSTDLKKLSYEVRGGDLIIQDSSQVISLIPTSSKVTLEIFYDGKIIAEQDFKVKLIPKPIIYVQELSKTPLMEFPQKLNVRIWAEDLFKHDNIYDSHYKLKSYAVKLVKDKESIVQNIFTQDKIPTKEEIKKYTKLIKSEPKAEWKLIVEVTQIELMTYERKYETVNTGTEYFILPIEIE